MREYELDDDAIQALSEMADMNSKYQFDNLDLMYDEFIGSEHIKA